MKTLNLYNLIYCLLITFILQSCSSEIGAWKNAQIKQSNHDELNALNANVLRCLKANDSKGLEQYLSKELLDDKFTSRSVESISNYLKQDSLVVLNDYYVVNKYVAADTINNNNLGINSFRLVYPGASEEMYISIFVPNGNKQANKQMLTAVYAHFPYGWKLNTLTLGLYTINGKTAPQLYESARKEYANGNLFAAANIISLATSCARPNDIWQYLNENDMYDFSKKVTNEVNDKYRFPITLNQISTRPRIIRMYNNTTNEGTYPNICYITKINIKDAAAIEKENSEIKKVIGTIMPGINKGIQFLYYTAYNETPVSTRVVPRYEIKDVLE